MSTPRAGSQWQLVTDHVMCGNVTAANDIVHSMHIDKWFSLEAMGGSVWNIQVGPLHFDYCVKSRKVTWVEGEPPA